MTALKIAPSHRAGVLGKTPDLRAIILAHGQYVWRLLRYLGVGRSDLEDVCQEVFTTAHRRLGKLEDDGVRPWLHVICVNHAKNYRRHARRHPEVLVDRLPESGVSPQQEQNVDLAHTQRRLLELLDLLDEDKRVVFVLHTIEEVPMEQVAKIVGCPLSTAYSRFQRARAELERKLVKK
jgi:RNA polymerase sigma-70 factor (ECF subfamily)